MKWKKEKPLKGQVHRGCLHCSNPFRSVKMNTRIYGYGFINITRNDEEIYVDNDKEWGDAPTLMKFENMARKDPDNDWRYKNYTPLHGEVYQRHGRNKWVLIKSNHGFA